MRSVIVVISYVVPFTRRIALHNTSSQLTEQESYISEIKIIVAYLRYKQS